MLIAGAGGLAKELLEAVSQLNEDVTLAFYDDFTGDSPAFLFGRFPILRSEAEAKTYFQLKDRRFALGIGDPEIRYRFYSKFRALGGTASSVISPYAKVGKFENKIGSGCTILSDCVIESSNSIGNGSLIHVASLVSHDVKIGNFCEISPRVTLLGAVHIGNFCRLGASSTILPKVRLGDNVIVGAGAVVTHDIPDNTLVVGVPARKVKDIQPKDIRL